jgi:hypothetical protein
VEKKGDFFSTSRIIALWQGENPPFGTPVSDAQIVDFGPTALILPGMINLHDHPTFDMLRLWPAPSSDVQPNYGRPLGTEPYADRYQWNDMLGVSTPEFKRLVQNPQLALVLGLNLNTEMVKYAKVKALAGGETTMQGAIPSPETDTHSRSWHRRWQIEFRAPDAHAAFHNRR